MIGPISSIRAFLRGKCIEMELSGCFVELKLISCALPCFQKTRECPTLTSCVVFNVNAMSNSSFGWEPCNIYNILALKLKNSSIGHYQLLKCSIIGFNQLSWSDLLIKVPWTRYSGKSKNVCLKSIIHQFCHKNESHYATSQQANAWRFNFE